ncbi:MAG: flagellar type III secretion system protein FliR [Veillonellaceae bacterium]|jgi:flagellar biosynthetic protein FliR|nr:flagellar type III secretion system protein FliR [Veillonellaceae bacterium]
MDLFELMQNQTGFFLLVFTRITGIFSMAPIFGSRNVSVTVKAGLALALTFILFPLVFNETTTIPDGFIGYLFLVASEFLIGLIIGFAASLVFSAIQMAGQLLDMQIGFGIVNVLDPQSGQQLPLVGNFKYILALLVFLATNSHHMLLAALFSSFKLIPVTGFIYHSEITEVMVNMVGGMFIIAIKICFPVLLSLLLMDVALGILARTMPQMNIFIVGVPGKIIVGLFVLSMALPFYIMFLEVAFSGMYKDIYRLLSRMG